MPKEVLGEEGFFDKNAANVPTIFDDLEQ